MQNFYLLGLQIPTILVVMSIILVWHRQAIVWKLAYFATLVVALAVNAITFPAIISATIITAFALTYQRQGTLNLASLITLLAVGLALGLHVVPGFNNHEFAQTLQLGKTSAEFDIWFNYDKSMFGILVLDPFVERNKASRVVANFSYFDWNTTGLFVCYFNGLFAL